MDLGCPPRSSPHSCVAWRGRKSALQKSALPVAGIALVLGASLWAIGYGSMDAVPALLMPWAGFYWSKLVFWRGVVK